MIAKYDLRLPEGAKPGVTVYLSTIKEQRFDVAPDYELDWRHHFLGSPEKRGHEPKAPEDWNEKMLPELLALEARINKETPIRLLRARGLARLPAWFAFGHTFSDVARYTVEVAQGDDIWQSDAKPSEDFGVQGSLPGGEALAAEGDTLAVGISVSDTLEEAVRKHLPNCGEKVRAVLFLRPARDLGRHCLRGAGDAAALAENAKTMIRAFVRHYGARRVLLYYLGPLSGACFIGHRLNAVCKDIQIMEWTDTTYVPSFLLT